MRNLIVLLLCLLFVGGCTVDVIYHDEQKAINTANIFLLDIIRGNYNTAYKKMSTRAKTKFSFKKFKAFLEQVAQEQGEIEQASFDYYRSVPGTREIELYYNVQHKIAGPIPYQFILEGDGNHGYKIGWVGVLNHGEKLPEPKMGEDIFAIVTSKGISRDGKR